MTEYEADREQADKVRAALRALNDAIREAAAKDIEVRLNVLTLQTSAGELQTMSVQVSKRL